MKLMKSDFFMNTSPLSQTIPQPLPNLPRVAPEPRNAASDSVTSAGPPLGGVRRKLGDACGVVDLEV